MIFLEQSPDSRLIELPSIKPVNEGEEDALVNLTYLDGGSDQIIFGNRRKIASSWTIFNLTLAQFTALYQWAVGVVGKSTEITQEAGEFVFGPAFSQEALTIQIKEVRPIGEASFSDGHELHAIEFDAILIAVDGIPINNGTTHAYDFLLEVDTRAISVDLGTFATLVDLEAAWPVADEGDTALVSGWLPVGPSEPFGRALMMFVSGAWARQAHLTSSDVTFWGTEPWNEPPRTMSILRSGMTFAIEGDLGSYQVFQAQTPGTGSWVATPYPVIDNYRPVVANVEALNFRGGQFRYASFSDYEEPGWTVYSNRPRLHEAGFIAKDGIEFPTMDTDMDKGPCLEKLNGFGAKLDNSKRFHWQTLGFNFFGAKCRLYVLDFTGATPQKILLRSGVNKTNSLDFANYSFDVEPQLFTATTFQLPKTTVESSDVLGLYQDATASNMVPLTYGNHPHAKAIPTVILDSIVALTTGAQNPPSTFGVLGNGFHDVLGEEVVEFQILPSNGLSGQDLDPTGIRYRQQLKNTLQNGFQYFARFSNSTKLIPIEKTVSSPLVGFEDCLTIEIYAKFLDGEAATYTGLSVSIYRIQVDFVVDDRVCTGFGSSYPQVMLWDSDFKVFHKLPLGVFQANAYGNGFTLVANPAYVLVGSTEEITVYERYATAPGGNSDLRKVMESAIWGYDPQELRSSGGAVVATMSVPYMWNKVVEPVDADPATPVFEKFYPMRIGNEADWSGTLSALGASNAAGSSNYSWVKTANMPGSLVPLLRYPGHEPRETAFWGAGVPKMGSPSSNLAGKTVASVIGGFSYTRMLAAQTPGTDDWVQWWDRAAMNEMALTRGANGEPAFDHNIAGVLDFPLTSEIHDGMKGATGVRLLGGFMFQAFVPNEIWGVDYGDTVTNGKWVPITLTLTLVHATDPTKDFIWHEGIYDQKAAGAPQTFCGIPHVFNNLPSALPGGLDAAWVFGNSTSGADEELGLMMRDFEWFSPHHGTIPIPDDMAPFVTDKYFRLYQWAGEDLFNPIPDEYFSNDGYLFEQYSSIRVTFTIDAKFGWPNRGVFLHCGSDLFNHARDEIYLQRTNVLSLTDSDLYVKVVGRNDKSCSSSAAGDAYTDPVSIMDDVARQASNGLRVQDSNIKNIDLFQVRTQVSDLTDVGPLLEMCSQHAWAVTSIDETDGLSVKSLDYTDYGDQDVTVLFDESNVLKDEQLGVKYRDYQDIVRDFTFNFHFNDASNEFDRVVRVSFHPTTRFVSVTGLSGLEPENSADTGTYNDQLYTNLKAILRNDVTDKFIRSKMYYDSGVDNAKTIEFKMASDFDPGQDATTTNAKYPVATAVRLMQKAIQFHLFNSWTVSFQVHMKYLVGFGGNRMAVGDYIELRLWFHSNGFPIRGFVKTIKPDLYKGTCEITLFSPVPPDVWAFFFDILWDGERVVTGYDKDSYVVDPIFRYPFKGAGAGVGEFPDGGMIGADYDKNEATFTSGDFADAQDLTTPF